MSKQESKVVQFTVFATMDDNDHLNVTVDAPEGFNDDELNLIADAAAEAIARAAVRSFDPESEPAAAGVRLMEDVRPNNGSGEQTDNRVSNDHGDRLDYIENALAALGKESDLTYVPYADRLDVASYAQ